jgi:diguanylate cyclase (GGDEF)-like protein
MRVEDRFKKVQTKIIVIFSLILFSVTLFLVTVILETSSSTLSKRVSSLTATNCMQLQLNINSYLEKVETTAALLFADEDYYQYDASSTTLDEYAQLKQEENITDRLVDLGLMENFTDFGIVYANDHTVGWLSNSTADLYPSGGMYDAFSACITNELTNDGWVFGLEGNKDRMFYLKRLNANAVLFTSFYNRELGSAFQYTQELQDMTIRLIDENNVILYSSNQSEIGSTLPSAIQNRIDGQDNVTIMDSSYLINTNSCGRNWQVVCSIPTKVLLKENIELRRYMILFAIILCGVFLLIGQVMIHRVARPMDGMVSRLEDKADFDQLSGLLNKISFQSKVTQHLAKYNPNRCLTMIMLDADNFKQVNDGLGHAYGDQVITRLSHLLKKIFAENALIGRIGGDEFAVYMEFMECSVSDIQLQIKADMNRLFTAYREEFLNEFKKCGLTLSVGICIQNDQETLDFLTFYEQTDAALYSSKRNGKNQYTLYREGMKNAEVQY